MPIDNTVLVAVVGVVSAGVTGILSNWDKLFHRESLVEAKVSGYSSSGNLREEIGVLLERTGLREQIEDMQSRLLKQQEDQFRQQIAEEGNLDEDLPRLQQIFDIIREEMPDYDDFRKLILPIWEKYYTLSAIEELNKFYSTDVMRDFRSKSKTITDEYWPIIQTLTQRAAARTQARIEHEVIDVEDEVAERPMLPEPAPQAKLQP